MRLVSGHGTSKLMLGSLLHAGPVGRGVLHSFLFLQLFVYDSERMINFIRKTVKIRELILQENLYQYMEKLH